MVRCVHPGMPTSPALPVQEWTGLGLDHLHSRASDVRLTRSQSDDFLADVETGFQKEGGEAMCSCGECHDHQESCCAGEVGGAWQCGEDCGGECHRGEGANAVVAISSAGSRRGPNRLPNWDPI